MVKLVENILKSNNNHDNDNNNINIKSVLADGSYDSNNENFKYLHMKKIDSTSNQSKKKLYYFNQEHHQYKE